MATPWWAKVSPDFYDDGKPGAGYNNAVSSRVRRQRAIIADTRLRDEPHIAAAFLNANVPMAVAARADAEYSVVKARKQESILGAAGMFAGASARGRAALTRGTGGGIGVFGAGSVRGEGGDFWSGVGDFWSGAVGVGKTVVGGLIDALNIAASPITVPIAASRAEDRPYGEFVAPWQLSEEDRKEPTLGRDPISFLLGRGAGLILGTQELSDAQKADMRRAGYDPDSFVSRYAWYYDDLDPSSKAVSDDDVRVFKQEFDPIKVDLAREIITSDALNEGLNPAGLSPEAQKFLAEVTKDDADPKDRELFERLHGSSTLHAGGYFSNVFGLERGSTESKVVAAVGDLALYWYIDPVVGAAGGLRALRNARYGFDAGSIAAMENKILALSRPGDISSAPATAAGRAFDRMLDTVDEVYTLQKSGDAAKMARAGLIAQQFMLRNPNMGSQFDVLLAMRGGQVDRVTIRDVDSLSRSARQGREVVPLVYRSADEAGKPAWILAREDGGKATQKSLNMARFNVVDRMSEFVFAEAINTGRPLNRGIALLPGEVAINRRFRSAVAPLRDALIRADTSVYKALDSKTGVVDLTAGFSRADEMIVGDRLGQWVEQNYRRKWTRSFERAASRFDKSFAGKTLRFDDPSGTEIYRRFVTQFMPRRLAYLMVNKWAMGSPAERMAQWRQTAEAVEHAAGLRSSKHAGELVDYLTKGVKPIRGDDRRLGIREVYTGIRSDNEIRAGGHVIAAGIHPYQMSDGVVLPSMREIHQVQQHTGLLSAVTGMFNTLPVRTVTSLWKVGKVANPANMMRQLIELVGLQTLEQGFAQLGRGMKARRFVASETIKGRLDRNEIARAANAVIDSATSREIEQLNLYFRANDFDAYHQMMVRVLNDHGFKGDAARILANMSEGVWIDDLARYGSIDRKLLAAAAPVDFVRRTRLRWMERTGVRAPADSAWHAYLDRELADAFTRSALDDLGAAKDQYAMLGNDYVLDDILEAADKGFGGVPARTPNTREWLGSLGDRGAQMWHNELTVRQMDPIGSIVQQGIALVARGVPPRKAVRMLDDAAVGRALRADPQYQKLLGQRKALGKTTKANAAQVKAVNTRLRQRHAAIELTARRFRPAGVESIAGVAHWLIKNGSEGEVLRRSAMRLRYDEAGNLIEGGQKLDDAMVRLAVKILKDHAYHLGGKLDTNGKLKFAAEFDDVLKNIAAGRRTSLDELSKIPEDARPKEISTPLYVPGLGKQANKRTVINMASKLYSFTVARPLSRLGATPSFIANRDMAYRQLAPVFDELVARGFDARQAAAFLEGTASKYAKNATFRYTDEATEHSVFSELTDNFLMFQRAMEDFVRRFMRVTAASPAVLARGWLLTEAAMHSGMVYPQTTVDDDGNTETHIVFAFPGSGLLAKAFAETGQALGWGDSDLILKPMYSSMSSQVRFINPALTNPLGFSTSPLIGLPMRVIRGLYPQHDELVTSILSNLEGGGERFFAEQTILQSLMPTPLARLVPLMAPDDASSQLASAVRNSFIYFGAAGLLPGPGATPDEIEDGHDAIMAMAENQLVWRAIIGLFSPMAPQYNEPEGLDLPGVSVVDQVRGITSIRSEWFDILQRMTKKYGTDRGFSEANIEWLRRHPKGESILNPEAFLVGTTRPPGTASDAGSPPSGQQATQWMLENKPWLEKHRAAAYYLLPQFDEGSFSSVGMRAQLRNGLREHKQSDEFYKDVRFAITDDEWWERLRLRNARLLESDYNKKHYEDWEQWETAFKTAHPSWAREKDRRQDPLYVHSELAPALARLLESRDAPQGVPVEQARRVYQHYLDYREQYNSTDNFYDQKRINRRYRESGDSMFMNGPVERLWRKFEVYE